MVNYYLDISEFEYTDVTYEVEQTDEETGKKTETNPIFVGYPYRSMNQEMISNMLPNVIFNI
jgi:hypothetical protein